MSWLPYTSYVVPSMVKQVLVFPKIGNLTSKSCALRIGMICSRATADWYPRTNFHSHLPRRWHQDGGKWTLIYEPILKFHFPSCMSQRVKSMLPRHLSITHTRFLPDPTLWIIPDLDLFVIDMAVPKASIGRVTQIPHDGTYAILIVIFKTSP